MDLIVAMGATLLILGAAGASASSALEWHTKQDRYLTHLLGLRTFLWVFAAGGLTLGAVAVVG